MIPFKVVRKIGRMLRGGAGSKEIFLGALCGVLIGFNPTAGLTLALAVLITLLLNANIGFTLLGAAVGRLLSLALAPLSFHTGFFLIHRIGLEGLYSLLANAPVTALMDLNIYAMTGSLPYAVVSGIVFGRFMSTLIKKIREQMVKAGENEKVSKVAGNKLARFLMWLVFGKQKVSTADVLAKDSPLLRKSGVILVTTVAAVGLVLQFFLLDLVLKKGLQSAISSKTGAEVNLEKADLSLAEGKLAIEGLQVTDPDKLTHNLVQIDHLTADLSISDLLRKSYTIDQLSISVLQTDVPRSHPGKLLVKTAEEEIEPAQEELPGKALDEYLVKAADWKKYGEEAYDYLKKRKINAEAAAKGEQTEPSSRNAAVDARESGYLKAAADLASSRPAWTVRQIDVSDVRLGAQPPCKIEGSELSSHPELNGRPTTLTMTPVNAAEPAITLVLRFDDPAALHEIAVRLNNIGIGDVVKTGDQLRIEDGLADISIDGTFSADTIDAPFTVLAHDLKTDNETLNQLKSIRLSGKLSGSLIAPRVSVEIGDNLKNAVTDAAKAKAKEAAKEQVDQALQSEEADELKSKARETLKGLF